MIRLRGQCRVSIPRNREPVQGTGLYNEAIECEKFASSTSGRAFVRFRARCKKGKERDRGPLSRGQGKEGGRGGEEGMNVEDRKVGRG